MDFMNATYCFIHMSSHIVLHTLSLILTTFYHILTVTLVKPICEFSGLCMIFMILTLYKTSNATAATLCVSTYVCVGCVYAQAAV